MMPGIVITWSALWCLLLLEPCMASPMIAARTATQPVAGLHADPVPATGRLRLGFPNDRAPISHGSAWRPQGMLPGLLRMFPADTFELHAWPAAELRQRLRRGQLEAVIGLPERDLPPDWLRSSAYLRVPNLMLTRRLGRVMLEAEDLRGLTVGAMDPLPVRSVATARHVVPASDAVQALAMLRAGSVEVVIGNALLLDHARRIAYDRIAATAAAPAGFDDVMVVGVAPRWEAWLRDYERRWQQLSASERAALQVPVRIAPTRLQPDGLARPLGIAGLLLALAGIALVHANGYWKLRREVRRRRTLQRRIDEVSNNLPVVVFQARRERGGRIHLELLAGDTPQMFSASPRELQAEPARILGAIEAADRMRVLATLMRGVRRVCAVSLRFDAHGVRGLRCIDMHAWPSVDAANEQRWTGYWMDVSDADIREQAIANAHATASEHAVERTRLVSALGSGIGEPMHALQAQLSLLHGSPLDGEQRAALSSLEDASAMLSRILDDVLDVSAGDEGDMALQSAPLDLRQLLGSVETLLRPVALAKGLDLHQQVDSAVAGWLQADGTRIRQVLFNLVGNAIKFTAQGSVAVVVQVLVDDEATQRIRIDVVDTGVGIAPDRQEAVFEPFAQAGVSTTRHYGGTGLGLGICRRLVTRMGGTLVLRSALGAGTVVRVELDLQRTPLAGNDAIAAAARRAADVGQQAAARQPTAAADAPAAASGTQVLVVEDHPTQQLLMQWWLRGMGLDVAVAIDGHQALQAWRSETPALVFTDDRMPGLGGAALVEQIRDEERRDGRPRVPIIGMSADVDGMRGVDVDRVLAKPISQRALRDAIAGLLPGGDTPDATVAPHTVGFEASDTPSLASLVIRFGSHEVARELVRTLRMSMEEDLLLLQEHWMLHDEVAVSQRLHRIAGGAGSLGLRALALRLRGLSDAQTMLDEHTRQALQSRLWRCIDHLRGLEQAPHEQATRD